MKIKLKNKDIIELNNSFMNCGNLKVIKFSYFVAKNLNLLKRELETIQNETIKLQDKHAKIDKNGKKIIVNNKIEMKDFDEFQKEYKELMEVENELELHKIKKSDISEDITVGQFSGIINLISQ